MGSDSDAPLTMLLGLSESQVVTSKALFDTLNKDWGAQVFPESEPL